MNVLVAGRPTKRSESRVRATTAVRCVSIPREDFLSLVETEPAFAVYLLRALARRLVEARVTA